MLNKLRTIFDNLPMMIAYKDIDNNVITVNKSAADFMGMNIDDLTDVPLKNVFPNDYERYYSYDKEVIETKKEKLNLLEKHHVQGKDVLVETSIIPILNENEDVENILIFMTDVTNEHYLEKENKKKEKLLFHQNKLAAMGEMLENIAHQWRQPLTTISAASSGVKMKKEMGKLGDEELIYMMNTISDTVLYLSDTINDFRSFIRPNENNMKSFEIIEALDKSLIFTKSKRLTQDIQIIKNIEEINIVSLKNQLIQVLINLLNNAIDVLLEKDGKKMIFVDVFSETDKLYIKVKDNAGGIPINIIDRIFEPYFTTKDKSNGTGIGLYMSQEIVDKLLKGKISVKNQNYDYEGEKYRGACFNIEIPII